MDSRTSRPMAAAEGAPDGSARRDFALLLAAALGTFSSYAPLLSVVPLWAADGGSGHGGAGAATGVTMAATVVAQVRMRRLLGRFGSRAMLAAGALLLGAPTFGYLLSPTVGWVLAVSAVRGAGFGIVTVSGSALVGDLVPVARRGRAVGWYGIAAGLPQVICLPLGVWGARHLGFPVVFITAGAVSLAAAPLAAAMSGRDAGPAAAQRQAPPGAPGRFRALAGPWTALIVPACAIGAVTAFLPLASGTRAVAPAALLVLFAAAMAGRWAAGVCSDLAGVGRLLVPGAAACALGMAGFALAASPAQWSPVVSLAAAAVYGAGFGVMQNETLVVMFRRAGVGAGGTGTASTTWNTAYDAGTGIGALGAGLASQALGIGGAFAATAALIAAVLTVAWSGGRVEIAAHRGGQGSPPAPWRRPGSS